MVNDEVARCPLCGGFQVERPDLPPALKQPRVHERLEKYIAELLKSPLDEFSVVGATQAGHDFPKDVHSWNPCLPMCAGAPRNRWADP